jgi:hypothetical protein
LPGGFQGTEHKKKSRSSRGTCGSSCEERGHPETWGDGMDNRELNLSSSEYLSGTRKIKFAARYIILSEQFCRTIEPRLPVLPRVLFS